MIEFKPIKGYEGLYSISSNGDVISMYNAITLKPSERNGYLYVNLYKGKKAKKHYIHRLVAETFIQNKNNYLEVNHIDSERFRRTGSNKIVVDEMVVMLNE